MKLTLKEVEQAIEEIKLMKDDYEKAHAMEDELRANILEHIATNYIGEVAAIASLGLSTRNIEFERWCA